MRKLTDRKTMTLKTVAEITGASYRTVAAYAQKAGWTKNGKQTALTNEQVTLLLEAMKQGANNQHDLASSIQGIETSGSKELRLALLYKEAAVLEKALRENSERERDIAVKELAIERQGHLGTKRLLAEQMVGTETYQRIAETGGLLMSDRDDLVSAYRRWR